jgi:hypothetical protein
MTSPLSSVRPRREMEQGPVVLAWPQEAEAEVPPFLPVSAVSLDVKQEEPMVELVDQVLREQRAAALSAQLLLATIQQQPMQLDLPPGRPKGKKEKKN